MFKKLICCMLVAAMLTGLAACRSAEPTTPSSPEANADDDFKIGIITGTVSQGEEEFRQAEAMKAKYGDMIVTATYPDNFSSEVETTISNVLSLASDPKVKAIVFCQAVIGAAAAIDKVKETRPEMFFFLGVPAEDPGVLSAKADIIVNADDLGMGVTVIKQAKALGATTFVHYSFPRHMSYQTLAARRDLFKKTCEEEGLTFIDETAPDPTSEVGVAGAQQFILEDVPKKVSEYGTETAFFSTNCSMQEPLIRSILKEGAIFPQQCCPSPYHGYPGALGIAIPDEKSGDVPYAIEAIKEAIAEGGGTGKFSTWPVPVNMAEIECGVEYSMAFLRGETNGRFDLEKLTELMSAAVGGASIKITPYEEGTDKFDNYLFILSEDYVVF